MAMHYYFMGVCGTAMGHVAVLLKQLGHEVTGADTGIYPPMSEVLAEAGIEVLAGYDPARLARLRPDVVVVGNAMSRGNPEVEWLLQTRALPMVSLPQLVGEVLIGQRRSIVVGGTHGKTTTATATAFLLEASRAKPGWLIGGVPQDLPGGAGMGASGGPFVVEGDEYDSAFFDKRSKFVHYRPRIFIVNNLEFDHADIFRDVADIQRSFLHGLRLVPGNGAILYNGDDPRLGELLPVPWAPCYRVGTATDCDLRIERFENHAQGSRFNLRWRGALWGRVDWPLAGLFNARNAAMAALAAGLALKPDDPLCALEPALLAGFRGVKRRLEIHREGPPHWVVEDFGHHPSAIRETLQALRARWPGVYLRACYEPRSNTARRQELQGDMAAALAEADTVLLPPVEGLEKVPEGQRLDLPRLLAEITTRGAQARQAATYEELAQWLANDPLPPPAATVFFSNGSFSGHLPKLISAQA